MKKSLSTILYTLSSLLFIYALTPGLVLAQDARMNPASILNPPAVQNGTDLSIYYLESIFGVVDGILHGSGSQIMGQMFGILNMGALILGGIIIIFTILISTLNTAHEGEILGKKWSSIWIPLRSALGIGLLLPKASGYSAIQIFIMWVVVQGVGLADSMWDNVLNYIDNGGTIIAPGPAINPDNISAAAKLYDLQVCMYTIQASLQQIHNKKLKAGEKTISPPLLINTIIPIPIGENVIKFPGERNMPEQYKSLVGACGSISWTPATGKNPSLINNYKKTGIQQMIADVAGPAQQAVNVLFDASTGRLRISNPKNYFPDCNKVKDSQTSVGEPQPNPYLCRLFRDAARSFEGIMRPAQNMSMNEAKNDFINDAKADGWILAGKYFSNLVALNKSIDTEVRNAIKDPDNELPSTGLQQNLNNKLPQPYLDRVVTLYTWAKNFSSIAKTTQIALPITGSGVKMGEINNIIGAIIGGLVAAALLAIAGMGAVAIAVLPALLIPLIKILLSFGTIATAQYTNADPITTLAVMGSGMIELVTVVWVVGAISATVTAGVLGAVIFTSLGAIITPMLVWIVPLLHAMLLAIFINGMALYFYLPLIPFFIFTFAAIGWVILVIEAIVAAPIIALGITHPEGHEIVGKADPAILLLVNVFLRPALMIVGFIGGIILSYVGIWIFNQGFFPAFGNILKTISVIALVFALPALMIIYSVAVIAILNQAFSLIHVLPDKVLRWIGGSPEMAGAEAAKSLGEVKSGMESGARTMGEGTGKALEAAGKRADERSKTSGEAKPKSNELPSHATPPLDGTG